MKILDTAFAKGLICVYDDSFNQNRHERDGGSLSYHIKPEEAESVKEELSYDGKWQPIGASVPALSGEYSVVSGNSRLMRNIILEPETNYCIIEVDQTGENYHICWGLVESGRPISELPIYLISHEVRMKATKGRYRVIYHAHPANIIALASVLLLTDEVFTEELRRMATECPVVFPAGVGVVGWMVPGGCNTAVATSRLMEEYDAAVQAHHSLLCAGEDFDLTFGPMYTIEKLAEILVKVLSIRPGKFQTITPQEFKNPAVGLHVSPPERFLCERQVESGRLKRQH